MDIYDDDVLHCPKEASLFEGELNQPGARIGPASDLFSFTFSFFVAAASSVRERQRDGYTSINLHLLFN